MHGLATVAFARGARGHGRYRGWRPATRKTIPACLGVQTADRTQGHRARWHTMANRPGHYLTHNTVAPISLFGYGRRPR
jgi:hypothetical protein